MPTLTPDDVIHQNAGGTATTSTSTAITASLVGGETTASADSTVVIALFGSDSTFLIPSPAGFLRAVSQVASRVELFYRGPTEGMAAGESSWNFTPTATAGGPVTWVVLELTGVSPSGLWFATGGTSATATSGTTLAASSAHTCYGGLFLAFHGALDLDTSPSTWSGHTNGVTEVVQATQAGTSSSISLSVSALAVVTPATVSTTATLSRTITATEYARSASFVLYAKGVKAIPFTQYVDGPCHGTVVGNTLGPSNLKILETVTAGVTVDAAAARSGSYGWKLTSTAAACNFTQSNYFQTIAQAWPVVNRRHFRFPTLPASGQNPELMVFTTSGGTKIVFRYIGSSGLIGCKVGTGTEVLSDQTITADQWFGIDVDMDLANAAAYLVRWAVDYNAETTDSVPAVDQTAAAGSGTGTALSNTGYQVGWNTASTATMYTADAAGAPARGQYPLGDVRVIGLKVDPAGTPTISDAVTTNFGVMTANGTVAAWNAANARDAVDDVPPDLSATRDAAVCLLASATAYAQFPAETVDLAALQLTPIGWRADASLWAASATAATIRLTVTNGTDTYTIMSETDPNADNTATPVWVGRLLVPSTAKVITQAMVDGLAYRIGSNDATPDIGIDCFVFSVACVKARPEALFGEVGAPVYVEAHRNPDTLSLVGATVNTDADSTVELTWEVGGVPASSGSIPPSSAQYVPLSADGSIETVNTVSLILG